MKAVLLVIPDDDAAMEAARLIASALTLNGYHTTKPGVLDWPIRSGALSTTPEEPE